MAVHKGVGHYGAPITLDQAKKAMAAAEARHARPPLRAQFPNNCVPQMRQKIGSASDPEGTRPTQRPDRPLTPTSSSESRQRPVAPQQLSDLRSHPLAVGCGRHALAS
jgi:hypothetical protein